MDCTITRKEEQPLLQRLEVDATVTFEGATPSRKDIKEQLAKQTKGKPELVIVTKITTQYGRQRVAVKGYVYKDAAIMAKLEHSSRVKKNTFEEPKAEEPEEKPEEKTEPAKEEPAKEKTEATKEPAEKKAEEPAKEESTMEKAEPAKEEPTKEKTEAAKEPAKDSKSPKEDA